MTSSQGTTEVGALQVGVSVRRDAGGQEPSREPVGHRPGLVGLFQEEGSTEWATGQCVGSTGTGNLHRRVLHLERNLCG